ncbi:MAG: ABC transporter substrate-binding protein [Actinomycetota bacterium]|nr:ABC transporter substrate-binding protein [Actinomycetota bacterium]
MRSFVDQYRARHGEPPRHGMAALGYDAMRLLADALERAGSTESADLSGALADTSGFASLGGPLSFGGDRRGAIRPVSIVEVDDGEHRLAGRWEG